MNTTTTTTTAAEAAAVTLADIEAAARQFSGERERLAERVAAVEEKINAIKRAAMPQLRRAVERAAEAEHRLRGLVEAAPALFERPRTLVLHGIKVGWVKGKGQIEIFDPARTVALIRKHLPDEAHNLIRVTEVPHKPGLAQLSVADLRRLGCALVDAGDAVVVKPMDGDVQRLIDRLLADAADIAAAAATEENA